MIEPSLSVHCNGWRAEKCILHFAQKNGCSWLQQIGKAVFGTFFAKTFHIMTTDSSLTNNSGSERPTPDQIASLAFHLYLKEGCPEGSELAIWLRAERILLERIQKRNFVQRVQRPFRSLLSRATKLVQP
jgi:hypothetical protein